MPQVTETAKVSDEKESEKPVTEAQAEPEKNTVSASANDQATEAKDQAAPSTEEVAKPEEAAVSKDEKSVETSTPKEAKAEEKAEPKEEKTEPKTVSSEANAAAQPKRSGTSGFRSVSGASGYRNTGAVRQGSDYIVTEDGNLATVQSKALKTQLDFAASENLPVTLN